MPYSASLDLVRRVRLVPSIVRAFWSTERAWAGATVRMHVETRFVPDDAAVKIEIVSADRSVSAVVHACDDAGVIEDSRCIVEHVIEWEDDAVLAVVEQTTVSSFCFVATIEKYGLAFASAPIYVPFEALPA